MNGFDYRIVSDQIGSPRLLVAATTGLVYESLKYDEFGNPERKLGLVNLPFGFAGGLYDKDTGLVHFGARDYDPEIGRWISKDPILFDGGDANLYGYVANDPFNMIDPSGLAGIPFKRDNTGAESIQRDLMIEIIAKEAAKKAQQKKAEEQYKQCESPGFSPVKPMLPAPLPPGPIPSKGCIMCTEVNPF